jgi:hypothetical protein
MRSRTTDAARATGFTAVAVALCVAVSTAQSPRVARVSEPVEPPQFCGTVSERDPRGLAVAPFGIADGEPPFFDQDPPLIRPDYTGPITLRNFNVVGDFSTVEFVRYDRDIVDGVTETWQRVNSRSVSGQVISIFEPTWTSAQFAKSLTFSHNVWATEAKRIRQLSTATHRSGARR